MKVYLVRHGEANSFGERKLSPKGILEVNSIAQKLLSKKIEIDFVFHSGKERAKETCEILIKNLFEEMIINVSKDLEPNSDIKIWGDILNAEDKNFLIVGHLPFLSDLTYYLTGSFFEFQTAEVVCLEKNSTNKWVFCWKLTP